MNKENFLAIIKEHQNLIYKICHSYCADKEKRNDLQQEIFIQLWNSLEKYDGRVKMSTWIYRVSLNTAISFYRNETKYNSRKTEIDESLLSLSYSDYTMEQDEKIMLLYRFINRLNDFDKALILLYLDDYKHEEIAEILGITKTNVATKVGRIKKVLKEQIRNY